MAKTGKVSDKLSDKLTGLKEEKKATVVSKKEETKPAPQKEVVQEGGDSSTEDEVDEDSEALSDGEDIPTDEMKLPEQDEEESDEESADNEEETADNEEESTSSDDEMPDEVETPEKVEEDLDSQEEYSEEDPEEKQSTPQIQGGGLKGLASAIRKIRNTPAEETKKRKVDDTSSKPDDSSAKKRKIEGKTENDESKSGGDFESDHEETKKPIKKKKGVLGEIEKQIDKKKKEENKQRKLTKQINAAKTLLARGVHKLPDPISDQTFEKQLKMIATKGVCHLFNSVHKAQREQGILVTKKRKQTKKMSDQQKKYVEDVKAKKLAELEAKYS